jgi:pumilio RNA-binding family
MTIQDGSFVTSQPMQMMLAPLSAPVMTAMPGMSGFAPMPHMTNMTYAAPVPFSWSIQGAFHNGEYAMSEAAPSQLPMHDVLPESAPVEVQSERHEWDPFAQGENLPSMENVPSQVEMYMTPSPQLMEDAQVNIGAVTGACKLRRRGQKCSTHEAQAQVECLQDAVCIGRDGETDFDAAQAREIADNLLDQLRIGGMSKQAAVASFENLAFTNTTTSRAAQIAIKEASVPDAVALAKALRGCIRNAVQSKHANHVVQQITESMPVGQASFIIDELKGCGHDIARHRFGCRVLCRILEHLAPQDESTLAFIEEILVDVHDLCGHEFGNFVARHLLEFGTPHHRHSIAKALVSDVHQYSKHKLGSHVVEAALLYSSPEDQRVLALQLASDQHQLVSVAANQYGRHVVRALLGLPSDVRKEAVEVLVPMEQKLKSLRYGRSILSSLRAASSL